MGGSREFLIRVSSSSVPLSYYSLYREGKDADIARSKPVPAPVHTGVCEDSEAAFMLPLWRTSYSWSINSPSKIEVLYQFAG